MLTGGPAPRARAPGRKKRPTPRGDCDSTANEGHYTPYSRVEELPDLSHGYYGVLDLQGPSDAAQVNRSRLFYSNICLLNSNYVHVVPVLGTSFLDEEKELELEDRKGCRYDFRVWPNTGNAGERDWAHPGEGDLDDGYYYPHSRSRVP